MDYRNIIKSRELRLKLLAFFGWIPDSVMLCIQYWLQMGKKLNLNEPKTWTEKLQYYKIYYRNPLLGICVDKYNVRKYIEQKGLSDILVNLYGVYSNANDIDFGALPEQFVLKTTDGGGGNNVVLIKDKKILDTENLRKDLNSWINIKDINAGREWAYTQIGKSQIIAEELLVNTDNPIVGIEDFKILCFHGEPKYIIVDKDRYIDHKRNFYNTNWEKIDVTTDHEQFDTYYPKPKNFELMINIARKLSSDFPFVRVDLYNINGQIYFGELTFYPWSGYVKFTPNEFDTHLGDLFDISTFNKS